MQTEHSLCNRHPKCSHPHAQTPPPTHTHTDLQVEQPPREHAVLRLERARALLRRCRRVEPRRRLGRRDGARRGLGVQVSAERLEARFQGGDLLGARLEVAGRLGRGGERGVARALRGDDILQRLVFVFERGPRFGALGVRAFCVLL